MNPTTAYGIISLVVALLGVDYFNKHPIDVKAIKRTLSTVRDTLAKESTTDIASLSAVIVISGGIVWVIVRDWV